MSTATPTKPVAAKRPAPPADAFWQKYSPHFELPVSGLVSVVLHGAALLLLLIIGVWLAEMFSPVKKQPMVGNASIVDPAAESGASTGGSNGGPKEAIEGPKMPNTPKLADLNLPDANIDPKDLELAAPIDPTAIGDPAKVGEAVREALAKDIAKAGSGKPGTNDGGTGNGSGGKTGDGNAEKQAERAGAAGRMQLTFNTRGGDDYLRQLAGLGAILAVQQADGKYIVFRSLNARPMRGKVEDVSKINRIYWVDANPTTVQQLSQIMGFRQPPVAIVAFFPETLEEELKAKERAYTAAQGRTIDQIAATKFVVNFANGKYTPEIVGQTPK